LKKRKTFNTVARAQAFLLIEKRKTFNLVARAQAFLLIEKEENIQSCS
jgi:hypothetical protein